MTKAKNVVKIKLTPTELKRRAKLWTALGSTIIFVSWVTQNFFQDKWHAEVVKVERNKMTIAINEINKNIYQTYLNAEQSNAATDSNYVDHLDLAFGAYVNYANLLFYLGVCQTTDNEQFLKETDKTFKENLVDIKRWNETGQIDSLSNFAEGLSNWEKENSSKVIGLFQSRLFELRDKEDFWNNVYLGLYIAGAICFVFAFVIDYKLTM